MLYAVLISDVMHAYLTEHHFIMSCNTHERLDILGLIIRLTYHAYNLRCLLAPVLRLRLPPRAHVYALRVIVFTHAEIGS